MVEDRSVFELAGKAGDQISEYGSDSDQIIESYNALTLNQEDHPVRDLVLIHGGYWLPEYDRLHLRPFAAAFADSGWRVHLVEYQRIPGSPDVTVGDIRSALDRIENTIVIGHSAGGHLALITADHPNVKGVIALAPVSDLVTGDLQNLDDGAIRKFLGSPAVERLDLDPLSKKVTKPTTILHGSEDLRVPVSQSRKFSATNPTVHYIEFEDMGHFELIDPQSLAWPVILRELKKFS
jgi:acetyl esterase/lipase